VVKQKPAPIGPPRGSQVKILRQGRPPSDLGRIRSQAHLNHPAYPTNGAYVELRYGRV